MIVVRGIGWIDAEEFGRARTRDRVRYCDCATFNNLWRCFRIFELPMNNFGRFDSSSQWTCYAAVLALQDAAIGHTRESTPQIGIVVTSCDGSLKSNLEYFADYVHSGRRLARGHLFIYTLPTSPAAEAAIHLRLHGPTLYLTDGQNTLSRVIAVAAGFVERGEADSMLVVRVEDAKALGILLARPAPTPPFCTLQKALQVTDQCAGITAILDRLDEAVSRGSDT